MQVVHPEEIRWDPSTRIKINQIIFIIKLKTLLFYRIYISSCLDLSKMDDFPRSTKTLAHVFFQTCQNVANCPFSFKVSDFEYFEGFLSVRLPLSKLNTLKIIKIDQFRFENGQFYFENGQFIIGLLISKFQICHFWSILKY